MTNPNAYEYPVDASISIYCDAESHAAKGLGLYATELVEPADAEPLGVYVFGVYRRLVDPDGLSVWRPDLYFIRTSGGRGEFRLDWIQVLKPDSDDGWKPVQHRGLDRRSAIMASESYLAVPDVWSDSPVGQWRRRYNFRCPRCDFGFRRGGPDMESTFDKLAASGVQAISVLGLQKAALT